MWSKYGYWGTGLLVHPCLSLILFDCRESVEKSTVRVHSCPNTSLSSFSPSWIFFSFSFTYFLFFSFLLFSLFQDQGICTSYRGHGGQFIWFSTGTAKLQLLCDFRLQFGLFSRLWSFSFTLTLVYGSFGVRVCPSSFLRRREWPLTLLSTGKKVKKGRSGQEVRRFFTFLLFHGLASWEEAKKNLSTLYRKMD